MSIRFLILVALAALVVSAFAEPRGACQGPDSKLQAGSIEAEMRFPGASGNPPDPASYAAVAVGLVTLRRRSKRN